MLILKVLLWSGWLFIQRTKAHVLSLCLGRHSGGLLESSLTCDQWLLLNSKTIIFTGSIITDGYWCCGVCKEALLKGGTFWAAKFIQAS